MILLGHRKSSSFGCVASELYLPFFGSVGYFCSLPCWLHLDKTIFEPCFVNFYPLNVFPTWEIVGEKGGQHFRSLYAVPGSLLGTFYAVIHKSVPTPPYGGHYYLGCTNEKTVSGECSNVEPRLEPRLVLAQTLHRFYYICGVQSRHRTLCYTQRYRKPT